jgi:uncharacterized protein (UPF0147 family)
MEKGTTIQTQKVFEKYNPIINFLHNLFLDYSLPSEIRDMAIDTRDRIEAIRDFEALKYRGVA